MSFRGAFFSGIFASFSVAIVVIVKKKLTHNRTVKVLSDTFVHVTDLSGKETISRVTGGMKVMAGRDEASLYATMLDAQDVAEKSKLLGITALHSKLRAIGGNRIKTPEPGAQSTLRALARLSH